MVWRMRVDLRNRMGTLRSTNKQRARDEVVMGGGPASASK